MATITRACTKCGEPAEDYEWEAGEYWCQQHVLLDTVGRKCMGCDAVCPDVKAAEDWYVDNAGQLCPECDKPVDPAVLRLRKTRV